MFKCSGQFWIIIILIIVILKIIIPIVMIYSVI